MSAFLRTTEFTETKSFIHSFINDDCSEPRCDDDPVHVAYSHEVSSPVLCEAGEFGPGVS